MSETYGIIFNEDDDTEGVSWEEIIEAFMDGFRGPDSEFEESDHFQDKVREAFARGRAMYDESDRYAIETLDIKLVDIENIDRMNEDALDDFHTAFMDGFHSGLGGGDGYGNTYRGTERQLYMDGIDCGRELLEDVKNAAEKYAESLDL